MEEPCDHRGGSLCALECAGRTVLGGGTWVRVGPLVQEISAFIAEAQVVALRTTVWQREGATWQVPVYRHLDFGLSVLLK